jgi:hypothetical protein
MAIIPAYKHIMPKKWWGPFPIYKEDIVVDGESIGYLTANGAYTTIFNIMGNPVAVMPIGHPVRDSYRCSSCWIKMAGCSFVDCCRAIV